MGFADSIKASAAKMERQVADKVIDVATDLFTAVVNLSPKQPFARYSKGEFINNWNVGYNAINQSWTGSRSYTGELSRRSIEAMKDSDIFEAKKSNQYAKDGVLTFTNVTPYGNHVEYIGWPAEHNGKSTGWKGKVGPYAPVRNAMIYIRSKQK